jgi:hypothetical protein
VGCFVKGGVWVYLCKMGARTVFVAGLSVGVVGDVGVLHRGLGQGGRQEVGGAANVVRGEGEEESRSGTGEEEEG